jgi:hyaluronan synthase
MTIEAAVQITKGEIFLFMDSDCDIAPDALEKAVQIFLSDTNIGAVTGHARVRGTKDDSSILIKIQDVWFHGQYRLLKGMETTCSSLTCCSGSLS